MAKTSLRSPKSSDVLVDDLFPKDSKSSFNCLGCVALARTSSIWTPVSLAMRESLARRRDRCPWSSPSSCSKSTSRGASSGDRCVRACLFLRRANVNLAHSAFESVTGMSLVRGLVPTTGESLVQRSGGPSAGSKTRLMDAAPVHNGPRSGPNPASSRPMTVNMADDLGAIALQTTRIAPMCRPLAVRALDG